MTSIFDQYEQATHGITPLRQEMSTTGFIHMKQEEDPPIFMRKKVNFAPSDPIISLAISNDILILIMSNNVMLKIDLNQQDKPEEIDLNKYCLNLKLSNIFLDKFGNHALISLAGKNAETPSELLYYSIKNNKLKQTSKLKSHEVTSVGWNRKFDCEQSTGPILLGTSKGLIFETELRLDGDKLFQTSLEHYWKQVDILNILNECNKEVFDIGKGSAQLSIFGIDFFQLNSSPEFCIIVTTATRFYQFKGTVNSLEDRPLLQQIFNKYLSEPESFHEVPGTLKYSLLATGFELDSNNVPKMIGWLTQPGVLLYQWDGYEYIQAQLIPLASPSSPPRPPIGLVLTRFHALILYGDEMHAHSLLSGLLAHQDNYTGDMGRPIRLVADVSKHSVWFITERAVFRYRIMREDRDVWQMLVEKGDFEAAKVFCKDNPAHMDIVINRQAESLFRNKQYRQSAELFAQTRTSFEEVALKFLTLGEPEPLKIFLMRKIEGLETRDKTQLTMLTLWVLELFLNQLGSMRDKGEGHGHEYQKLQSDLEAFIGRSRVQECIKANRGVVYELMSSHGDKRNLVSFTELNRDYERVVRHHIYKNNHLLALEIVKREGSRELLYQFAPALMQAVPKHTVDALISMGRAVSPTKLLPALLSCDTSQSHEAIRYLEFCVVQLGSQNESIHNLLLSLYVSHSPDKLLHYLAMQGNDSSMVPYDAEFALRLCYDNGLREASVQLCALLGQWDKAVDLALESSVELAKQIASSAPSTSASGDAAELKHKLWLKIARHVVREEEDLAAAMAVVQQSCPLVKIEDILPFFRDFDTLGHFKSAICASLERYHARIQELKDEMEDATQSASTLRQEVNAFRNSYALVQSRDSCAVCLSELQLRAFCVFPCGHRFHTSCLVRQRADECDELARNKATSMDSAECLYCGDAMINAIDQPFFNEEDYENIFKEWQ